MSRQESLRDPLTLQKNMITRTFPNCIMNLVTSGFSSCSRLEDSQLRKGAVVACPLIWAIIETIRQQDEPYLVLPWIVENMDPPSHRLSFSAYESGTKGPKS